MAQDKPAPPHRKKQRRKTTIDSHELLPPGASDGKLEKTLFDDFTPSMTPPESPQKEIKEKEAKEKAKPHYYGHRKRVKRKINENGGEKLEDYEMLEAVLFRALPRQDTKPIAKELLARFGSFAAVINAPEAELHKVKYIKNSAVYEFRLLKAAAQRLLKSEISERPVMSSWVKVVDYLRTAMAEESREQFRILFLDKRNRLILDEVQQEGTVDHTPVYIREVCRRALELNATALILSHNHPSGDPTPSRGDIEMTREIVTIAKGLGITIHDHIIVARDGHASFKGLGLL